MKAATAHAPTIHTEDTAELTTVTPIHCAIVMRNALECVRHPSVRSNGVRRIPSSQLDVAKTTPGRKTAIEFSTCRVSISTSDKTAATEAMLEIANAVDSFTVSPNIIIAASFKLTAPATRSLPLQLY